MASFYDFTNVQTNPRKAIMLTNNTDSINEQENIEVEINNVKYDIKVAKKGHLERFLGVYINFGNNRKALVKSLKAIIRNVYRILHRKQMFIDHLTYIFNKVIILKLEYLMQTSILAKSDCDAIIASYRMMTRTKLSLTGSTSNNILHAPVPIGLIDLFSHQKKVQLDSLNIQLNDNKILGHASYIQLEQLWHTYFYSLNPLL
jgi:hypothetical protein